ncbi:MAG: PhoH family protein, partial [Asticcacaulis sp.]
MAAKDDFIDLSTDAVLAVSGPAQRYLALIESAFSVLVETPGNGLKISGDTRNRHKAAAVIRALIERYDTGVEVGEDDVRRLIQHPSTPLTDKPQHRAPAGPYAHHARGLGRPGASVGQNPRQAAEIDARRRVFMVFG